MGSQGPQGVLRDLIDLHGFSGASKVGFGHFEGILREFIQLYENDSFC